MMEQKGTSTDKMSVYLASHDINDLEVAAFVVEYDRKLRDIVDADKTMEARVSIFDEVRGPDGHRYCLTFGSGVRKAEVKSKQNASSMVYEAEIFKLKTIQDRMLQYISYLHNTLAFMESKQGESSKKSATCKRVSYKEMIQNENA